MPVTSIKTCYNACGIEKNTSIDINACRTKNYDQIELHVLQVMFLGKDWTLISRVLSDSLRYGLITIGWGKV